jgi:hypothetical protein
MDDMLLHKPSTAQPFMGEQKNIKWTKHTPLTTKEDAEEGYSGQIDEGNVDLFDNGEDTTIRVTWDGGVTDHHLTIEIPELGVKLTNEYGIQPNYAIQDADKDGKKEIIIWSGLWDPRMPGEDGVIETTYEGHSASHRYVVATYKLIRGQYYLWDIYTTKKKYEPFCKEQPI